MENPPSLKSEAAASRRTSRKVIEKRGEEVVNGATDLDLAIAEDPVANLHAVERGGAEAEIEARLGKGVAAEAVRHAEEVENRDVVQGLGTAGGHDRLVATKTGLTDVGAAAHVTKNVAKNLLVQEAAKSNNVVEVNVVLAVEVAAVRFRRVKIIRQTMRLRQNQRLKTIITIMTRMERFLMSVV